MRIISNTFMDALMKKDGMLHPIYERILRDETLLLSIRNGYINIYYRGGSLARIEENMEGKFYFCFFDSDYNKNLLPMPSLPQKIQNNSDAHLWASAFSSIKEVMDDYFVYNRKPEREFQQVVSRENNKSSISNETEYFITDIEFNASEFNARFDMLGMQILTSDRRKVTKCKPVFFEMKYGINSLGGNSGLLKHINDIYAFISNHEKNKYSFILEMMESQFSQLYTLGLIDFKMSGAISEIKINENIKPEVIFILANCNPRSKILSSILHDKDLMSIANTDLFDLKFFVSAYSGYALHADCMFSLPNFKKIVSFF